MRVTDIKDEDFVNYKRPSMFISTTTCSWKCCSEAGIPVSECQNNPLSKAKPVDISNEKIIERYLRNNITHAIVFGGLEPLDQFTELIDFIDCLRAEYECMDPVVIYTGYYRNEVEAKLTMLKRYQNIIIKWGRYIPNREPRFDDVLGVKLISDNQYAEAINFG